jgi:regulator of protease activity HflC (stomatin/prohibitin superfamily)
MRVRGFLCEAASGFLTANQPYEGQDMSPKLQAWIVVIALSVIIPPAFIYQECRIDVPNKHIAVLTKKVGKDLDPGVILAPTEEYKGVQREVLTEGRYYYNPYVWDWQIVEQVEIPQGKLGVRIRMYGEDLPAGELIAVKEEQKGILAEVLRPGRYPINAIVVDGNAAQQIGASNSETARQNYAEVVELHDPETIPAGFKGLVTELSSPMPNKPNELLSVKGFRGAQTETLEPGTYYLNPYMKEVRHVDCRSKRYDLMDIGFPTKDGFWVNLEGIIEFRIKPEQAAATYILYNEERNNKILADQVIAKVVLPNARAYTRLRGSNHSGREFITGNTRALFQEDFQKTMKATCDEKGIEVIQALITKITPPEKIADPVRRREIAVQQELQYKKEIEQQAAEKSLAVQKAMVEQKKALVTASQEVVVVTTEAKKKQEVAMIDANKRLAVAEQKLLAAKDQASAIMAKGKAGADVVMFANLAEAAGWQKAIAAFSGNGAEFARWTLYKKLAPAFRRLMINTDNSPLMDVFKAFETKTVKAADQPGTPVKN